MKIVKYNINDQKVKALLSTDTHLNRLIKCIRFSELIIEPDGFSCIIKYIIGQQISDKAREKIWNRFKLKFKPIHQIKF